MRQSDPQKLDALAGRLVGDMGACVTGSLIVPGDQLGLYKAMADGEPVTAAELASRTGLKERHVREWLSAQAAAEYVQYDEATDSFSLSPEQAMAFAEEGSPAFFAGAFEIVLREAGITRSRAEGTVRYLSIRREEFDRRFPGLLDTVIETARRDPSVRAPSSLSDQPQQGQPGPETAWLPKAARRPHRPETCSLMRAIVLSRSGCVGRQREQGESSRATAGRPGTHA